MPWPQTGATQYLAHLRLPDKGHSIERVDCLLYRMARIYDLWDWTLDKRNWFLVLIRMTIELKYRNAP